MARTHNRRPDEPNGHNVIGALGFLKQDVVRCMAFRKDGEKCSAPAMRGIRFCVNHKALAADFPGDHPDRPPPAPIRVQVRDHTGVIEIDPRDQSRRLAIAQKQAQQNLIEQMTREYEIAPGSVFDVMREGLRATRTTRREKLTEDGTVEKVTVGYRDNGNPITEKVYEDIVEPDHDMRIAYVRELLDRLYGKPKARQEITGAEGGPVTVVGLVQNLVALERAQRSGSMESYYEDIGEVEDADVVGEDGAAAD